MNESMSFRDPQAAAGLRDWWQELEANRGEHAALRGCRDLREVYFTRGFRQLLTRLQPYGWDGEGVAAVAAVASHVEREATGGFARQLAAARKGRSAGPPLSESRFRRLLQHASRGELYPALVRALYLLDNRADLLDLADGVYRWDEPTRKRWALDYYETLADGPQQ